MGYDDTARKATVKYMKKLQRLYVNYRKEDYERDIKPYIEKSGLPAATFIKQAIAEKIEREKERN